MRVLIKGAGSLATGIASKLKVSGFDVLMTEVAIPSTIHRTVAFSRAVYEGRAKVEGIESVHVRSIEEIEAVIASDQIPVIVDSRASIREQFKPDIIVDAVTSAEEHFTHMEDADFVVGLGKAFTPGVNCHCAIECERGHYLGRVIYENNIKSEKPERTEECEQRILRAVAEGEIVPVKHIGDKVAVGDVVARTGDREVRASISGIVRGLLQKGVHVVPGMRIGNIDDRDDIEYCYTISDKARAIGGGVLEAVMRYVRRRENIGIVLLAAGAGKRFGSNKLLADYQGKEIFKYGLEAAVATGCSCTVVTGYDKISESAKSLGASVVLNDAPEEGISRSIKLGLESVRDKSAVIFSVCDQPGITTDTYNRLIVAYATGTKGLSCMGEGQNLLGNPCIFGRKYYKELMNLEGDNGGKRIIMRHTDDMTVVAAKQEELRDIDYSEDLKN